MTDATSSPPTVTSLTVYPVKSCGGVSLQSARVSATGLLFDRAWMVVDQRTALAIGSKNEVDRFNSMVLGK